MSIICAMLAALTSKTNLTKYSASLSTALRSYKVRPKIRLKTLRTTTPTISDPVPETTTSGPNPRKSGEKYGSDREALSIMKVGCEMREGSVLMQLFSANLKTSPRKLSNK